MNLNPNQQKHNINSSSLENLKPTLGSNSFKRNEPPIINFRKLSFSTADTLKRDSVAVPTRMPSIMNPYDTLENYDHENILNHTSSMIHREKSLTEAQFSIPDMQRTQSDTKMYSSSFNCEGTFQNLNSIQKYKSKEEIKFKSINMGRSRSTTGAPNVTLSPKTKRGFSLKQEQKTVMTTNHGTASKTSTTEKFVRKISTKYESKRSNSKKEPSGSQKSVPKKSSLKSSRLSRSSVIIANQDDVQLSTIEEWLSAPNNDALCGMEKYKPVPCFAHPNGSTSVNLQASTSVVTPELPLKLVNGNVIHNKKSVPISKSTSITREFKEKLKQTQTKRISKKSSLFKSKFSDSHGLDSMRRSKSMISQRKEKVLNKIGSKTTTRSKMLSMCHKDQFHI